GHGAPETVDRLVRVPYHHQSRAGCRRCQELQQLELGGVDVLELVDEDQAEATPQALEQLEVRLQELDRLDDQISKVEHAPAPHTFLVGLVGGGEHAKAVARAGLGAEQKGGGVNQVLLHEGD